MVGSIMAGPSTPWGSGDQNKPGFKVVRVGSEMKLLRGFPHDHELFWRPEDNRKQARCAVCFESVFGHPTFSCYQCPFSSFIIHERCAEIPLEIQVTFHGKHRLLVFEKTPEPLAAKLCSICNHEMHKYGYSCLLSKCNFRVHVKCATSPECRTNMDSQHHRFVRMPQPMTLGSVSYTCGACGGDSVNTNVANAHHGVSDEESKYPYVCSDCHIMVHRRCVSLPWAIRIRQHPQHLITRTYCLGQHHHQQQQKKKEQTDEGKDEDEDEQEDKGHLAGNYLCGVCYTKLNKEYGGYYCKDCNFACHSQCTVPFVVQDSDDNPEKPSFKVIREIPDQDGKTIIQEIEHIMHKHNLILLKEIAGDPPKCIACFLDIQISSSSLPPSYFGCPDPHCNFILHASCAMLPKSIRISNKILLYLKPKIYTWYCDFCCQNRKGFVYSYEDQTCHTRHCCMRCIPMLRHDSIQRKDHRRAHGCRGLLFLAVAEHDSARLSIDCIACRERKETIAYFKCAACSISLDTGCAGLPMRVKLPNNKYDDHDLVLTGHPLESDSYQSYCLICEEERDQNFWFYCCHSCDFTAHVECVLDHITLKLEGYYTHLHPHFLTGWDYEDKKRGPRCEECIKKHRRSVYECDTSDCEYTVCSECYSYK